jgi:hypothetical protein
VDNFNIKLTNDEIRLLNNQSYKIEEIVHWFSAPLMSVRVNPPVIVIPREPIRLQDDDTKNSPNSDK